MNQTFAASSDRDATESELLRLVERFNDFTRIGPHWYWEWDADFRYTYVSEGVFDVLGYSAPEVIGKSRGDLTRDRLAAASEADFDRHERNLRNRRPFRNHHIVARHPDGSTVHILANGNPFFGPGGTFLGYRGVSTDITQQVIAEALLRDSEQRFREFAAASADRLWETDTDHRYTYLSPGSEVGRPRPTPEELLGKLRWETEPVLDPATWEPYKALVAARQPIRGFQYSRHLATGEVVWIRTSANPMFDGSGAFVGYRGVNLNVTNYVEAAHAAEVAEARLMAAIEVIDDGFVYFDADERFVLCNSRYLDFYPNAKATLEPGTTFEAIARNGLAGGFILNAGPDLEAAIAARLERFRNPGASHEQELADGRWLRAQDYKTPDGGTVGLRVDITDLKRQQQELSRAREAAEIAEARLRAAIEAIEDGFVYFDADERFVLCNSKLTNYYGEAAHLFVPGTKFEDIVRNGTVLGYLRRSVDDVEAYVADRMRRFREASGIFEQEFADGRWLRVMDRKTADGGTVGFRVDITDLKRRELALSRAREEADAKSKAKTEFLSSMSHELRTPMNAILGFSQLLEATAASFSPAQIAEYAHHIVKSGQHLITLVNQILELSKIEAGQAMLAIETVAAPPLIRECLDMVEGPAADARITIVDATSDALLPPLSTDSGRFRQVMLNLLSNAVKYNRPGGSVTVSAGVDGRFVRIEVADTGDGIPLERRDQMFQPFNRLGREDSGIEGTGIGLYLTRGMVEQLGGAIGFDSTPGAGTTFWVDFPMSAEAAEAVEASRPIRAALRPAAEGRHTVLYVEDNMLNQKLMAEIFARFDNVDLVLAGTAEEGLELIGRVHPDLIVMDINLPGISGFTALERLSNDGATAHIPVIALTAVATPTDVARGLAAGFTDYLTKPVDVSQVIGAVERRLGLR